MPPTKKNLKRSHAIKISITPAVYEKLVFVSETLGMSTAQIAALAVSEYVANKSISFRVAQTSSEQMIESMAPHMAELFQKLGDKEI